MLNHPGKNVRIDDSARVQLATDFEYVPRKNGDRTAWFVKTKCEICGEEFRKVFKLIFSKSFPIGSLVVTFSTPRPASQDKSSFLIHFWLITSGVCVSIFLYVTQAFFTQKWIKLCLYINLKTILSDASHAKNHARWAHPNSENAIKLGLKTKPVSQPKNEPVDDRPIKCDICGERFDDVKSMQAHAARMHNAFSHKCKFCVGNVSFKYKKDLYKHYTETHGKQRLQFNKMQFNKTYKQTYHNYSYQFEHGNSIIQVVFNGVLGPMGPKPLSPDQVEGLSRCDSISRQRWALNLMNDYPVGIHQRARLTGRALAQQTPFEKTLEDESWTEAQLKHTHSNDRITLSIYRLHW